MKTREEVEVANAEFIKKYDDSKYPKPSVTADIVIFQKTEEEVWKVLLIKRGAAPFEGCYALPGGFVNMGESIEEAAQRELEEETTLRCNNLEQFGTYSAPGRDPRRWVISHGFLAVADGKMEEVKAGDDAAEAKWFEISFKEKEQGEWHLCLRHEEEQLFARLKETSVSWTGKKRFATIESKELAFDHQLILADAIMQLRKWFC